MKKSADIDPRTLFPGQPMSLWIGSVSHVGDHTDLARELLACSEQLHSLNTDHFEWYFRYEHFHVSREDAAAEVVWLLKNAPTELARGVVFGRMMAAGHLLTVVGQ